MCRLGLPVLLLVTAAVLLVDCGSEPSALKIGRPPVILVSIDTLRSDRLPAYGYDGIETPHFDRFAADAILFERAYSHYPLTLPSHVTLFTGQLPPRHGVRDNRGYRLGDELPTLASVLAGAGYETAGVVSSAVLRRQTGVGRGFARFEDTLVGSRQESLRIFPQRPGEQSIAIALEWLEGLAPDHPLFLFLHLFEPHTPYEAPERFASRVVDPYDAEVAYVDEVVEVFLDGLRKRGIYEESLIILLSDHGEGLGDHGESEHGLLLYRESLQVPLMIKLPHGRRAGERWTTPVALVDIMPTVLDLLDLPTAGLEGQALFGAEPPPANRPIYSETWFARHQYGWSELKSVIEDRRHYIRAPRPELYDLVEDPDERQNLLVAGEPASRLAGWIEEIGAGAEATAELSREELESLASLGYIGGAETVEDWRGLPDPKDHVHRVEELWSEIERIGSADDDVEAELRALELSEALGIRNEALFRTIAVNLLRAGRPALALRVLEPYEDSEEPSTRIVLGKALSETGRLDGALSQFRALLQQESDNAEVRLGMGITLLMADRTHEARPHLQQAVELDPTLAEAWNGLGVVLARAGEPERAEPLWRRAVELDPALSDTWFNLALIHRRTGNLEAAREDMRRYIELVDGAQRQRALAMLRELEAAAGPR